MKKLFSVMFLSVLLCAPAWADMDHAAEARREAERKAQRQKAAQEQAKADAMKQQALDKAHAEVKARGSSTAAMRKSLGKSADGKSDAEVQQMYQAKATSDAKNIQAREAATRPMKDAQMKQMYGKDTKDLMNMSDKELEEFSKQMEKKYGQ